MGAVIAAVVVGFVVWVLIAQTVRGATHADEREWRQMWNDPHTNMWEQIDRLKKGGWDRPD